MREVLSKMDGFMKRELILIIIFSLSGSITANIVIKLQGVAFTLSTIALIAIIKNVSGLFLPFLRSIKMGTKYLSILVMGVMSCFMMSLYSVIDIDIWLLMIIIGEIPLLLMLSAFFIDYRSLVQLMSSHTLFTEIMYLEKLVVNFTALIGASLTYILSNNLNIGEIVIVVIVLKVLGFFIALQQYYVSYKGLNIKKKNREDGRSDLYIKKTLEEIKEEMS